MTLGAVDKEQADHGSLMQEVSAVSFAATGGLLQLTLPILSIVMKGPVCQNTQFTRRSWIWVSTTEPFACPQPFTDGNTCSERARDHQHWAIEDSKRVT